MRSIGQVLGAERARAISNYLHFEGIDNQIEPEDDGRFVVWINDEEHIEAARLILSAFLQNPDDPRYEVKPVKKPKSRPMRVFDRTNLYRASYSFGTGPLTIIVIMICCGLYLVCDIAGRSDIKDSLMMTGRSYSYFYSPGPGQVAGLREILHGQIWRLITPVFLHGGPLHLIFNMMMLHGLGSLIEARLSSRSLLILVVGLALVSNMSQFLWDGPHFLGISGVLYGLFGYAWIRGRCDTRSGLFIDSGTVRWMLGWLVLCFFLLHIANGAHVGGLVAGAIWGYIDSKRHWIY